MNDDRGKRVVPSNTMRRRAGSQVWASGRFGAQTAAVHLAVLVIGLPVVAGAEDLRMASLSGMPLHAASVSQVRIEGGFWAPRVETAITRTLDHCLRQCEKTGRLANFDRASGVTPGRHEGYFFNDSDVYKVIEGAAYALQQRNDPHRRAEVMAIIQRIVAAQRADGYLNTYYRLHPELEPFSDVRDKHELYCAGHLLEAGIAMHAAGDDTLLNAATRNLALIASEFGPRGRADPPGHQEIELAIARLARELHDDRYLPLARFFLERRGRAERRELYGEYAQDHRPLSEQTEIVGHAVRATYMFAGACELAAADESYTLPPAVLDAWRDVVDTKMYVTGGVGSSSHNEGFTRSYDLPTETAYAETCASIGMMLWSHRLFLLTGDAKYADVLERSLYNGVLAGISLGGDRFFYSNPLVSRGQHERRAWYACACCPPNLLRTIAGVGRFAYAYGDDGVYVILYADSTAMLPVGGDATVVIEQRTDYPWSGDVSFRVTPSAPVEFPLHLRVPAWCDAAEAAVNGRFVDDRPDSRGFVTIRRRWSKGDEVALRLPMNVRRTAAHSRVDSARGRVALERGPLVYCLERVDHVADVHRMIVPPNAKLVAEHCADLLGGVTVVRGESLVAGGDDSNGWDEPLYRDEPELAPASLTAIPYYAWQNRGRGDMLVWVAESPAVLPPGPVSWVTASASHCYRGDSPAALHDRLIPSDSLGAGLPRFTWWPRKGTVEWVQYDLNSPRAIDRVAVYWFVDARRGGGCDLPVRWRVLWRDGDQWRPVESAAEYVIAADRFNEARFRPVTTTALRLEVQLAEDYSAGILEWKLHVASR